MATMSGETCNICDGDIECEDNVVALVCPHCGNITGVCANCAWHIPLGKRPCDNGECPFNLKLNKEDNDEH